MLWQKKIPQEVFSKNIDTLDSKREKKTQTLPISGIKINWISSHIPPGEWELHWGYWNVTESCGKISEIPVQVNFPRGRALKLLVGKNMTKKKRKCKRYCGWRCESPPLFTHNCPSCTTFSPLTSFPCDGKSPVLSSKLIYFSVLTAGSTTQSLN